MRNELGLGEKRERCIYLAQNDIVSIVMKRRCFHFFFFLFLKKKHKMTYSFQMK
jgi:hypothetical protein